MSVVLTYMTWNFSPDLANVDQQDSSNKDAKANTIGKPLDQGMSKVVAPYQIIHSNGDDTEGMEATRSNVEETISPLKNQRVLHAEQMHSNHNFIYLLVI